MYVSELLRRIQEPDWQSLELASDSTSPTIKPPHVSCRVRGEGHAHGLSYLPYPKRFFLYSFKNSVCSLPPPFHKSSKIYIEMATVYNTKLPPPPLKTMYFARLAKILPSPPCHFSCSSKVCCQKTVRHEYFSYCHEATNLTVRDAFLLIS